MNDLEIANVNSIELLLQRFLSKKPETIIDLASHFQKHGIISQECEKDIEDKAKHGSKCGEAVERLCQELRTSKGIAGYLKQACESKDVPGDVKITKVILTLQSCDSASTQRYLWLLKSWNALTAKSEELSNVIKQNTPSLLQDRGEQEEKSDQLLTILLHSSEEKPGWLEKFVEDLKNILGERDESSHEETGGKVDQPADSAMESDDAEWLNDAMSFLEENYNSFAEKVKELWPGKPGLELLDKTEWPTSLFDKFENDDERAKLKKFIQFAKFTQVKLWANANNNLLKENKEKILPLVEQIWDDKRLLNFWPMNLTMRLRESKETQKSMKLMSAVESIMSQKAQKNSEVSETPQSGFEMKKIEKSPFGPDSHDGLITAEKAPTTVGMKPSSFTEDKSMGYEVLQGTEVEANHHPLLQWLKDSQPKLNAMKARLQSTVNQLVDDKRVAEDQNFPTLLIEYFGQQDPSTISSKILRIKDQVELESRSSGSAQVIVQQPYNAVNAEDGLPRIPPFSQYQSGNKLEDTTNRTGDVGTSVDKEPRDYTTLEIRVLTRPKKTDYLKYLCISPHQEAVVLSKRKGCKYYFHQQKISRGEKLEYFFCGKDGKDGDRPRYYPACDTEGISTRVKYEVVNFGGLDDAAPPPYKFLPKTKRLEDFDKNHLVEEIIEWTSAVVEKPGIPEVEDSLKYWTKKVLGKWKNTTIATIVGCAIITAFYDKNRVIKDDKLWRRICRLLRHIKSDQKANQDLYQEVLRIFPKEPQRRKSFEVLLISLEKLLCHSKKISKNFFLVLPFYWLLRGEENVDLFENEQKYHLPGKEGQIWTDIKFELKESNLLNFKNEIIESSKSVPWILTSYLYFFGGDSLLAFFKDEKYSHHNVGIIFLLQRVGDSLLFLDRNETDEVVKMYLSAFEAQKKTLAKRENLLSVIGCELEQLLEKVTLPYRVASWTKNAVALYCARALKQLVDVLHAKPNESGKDCTTVDLEKSISAVNCQICKHITVEADCASLERVHFFNDLLGIEWEGKKFESYFLESIVEALKKQSLNTKTNLSKFFVVDMTEKRCNEALTNCFKIAAMSWMTNCMDEIKNRNPWDELKTVCFKYPEKLTRFYNAYLMQKLREYKGIDFLLEWEHAIKVLGMFFEGKNYKGEAWEELTQRVENFEYLSEKVFNQLISYGDYEKIRDTKERCATLWSLIKSVDNRCYRNEATEDFEVAFNKCRRAVDDYGFMKNCFQTFIADCDLLDDIVKINVTELKESIEISISDKTIADIKNIFSGIVREESLVFWKRVVALQGNDYYVKKSRDKASELVKTTDIHWRNALREIFLSAQSLAETVSTEIQSGTLCLRDIPLIFEQQSSDHSAFHYVTKQLDNFFNLQRIQDCEKVHDIRRAQILEYHRIKTAMDASKCLFEIKDILKLSGEFHALSGFDEKWLDEDLDHLPEVSDEIQPYKAEELEVLKAFLQQKELVQWLMKETKTIKDIITFGELAKSNARDDRELDKISALRTAAEAFSPLIYGLRGKPDMKKLQSSCETVFAKCLSDKQLLVNWRAAGSEVAWFAQIVEIFGETGKHSMKIVQKINDEGIYVIKRTAEGIFSMENYIKLQNCTEVADHSSLRDLQSHIMLITGEKQGKDQAKHADGFVTLLAAVENLAQVSMDLAEAGCLMFDDLRISIRPTNEAKKQHEGLDAHPAFNINFSLTENASALSGTGNIATIHEIISIMREILKEWKNYLKKAYSKYYYLNEFSNDQITYLCKELGKEKINRLPNRATMLLNKITSDIDWGNLNFDLKDATKTPTRECSNDSIGQTNVPVSKVDAMKRAVRTLHFQDEIEEDIAKAAVAAKWPDVAKCSKWAFLNEDNKEIIEKFLKMFNEQTESSYQERKIEARVDILYSKVNKTMKDILKSLLDGPTDETSLFDTSNILTLYRAFTMEAGSLTMDGLLNIEHLGKFLSILMEKSEQKLPKRNLDNFPLRFSKGKPNIIICKEHEIPTVVLQLYAKQDDEPLPTTSEVLFCHENTTECQVDRFFRRALFKCPTTESPNANNRASPIFCLASAQKLTYQVAESAANLFHDLTGGDANINREYQLVIISADRDHLLSACFDQEHLTAPEGFADKQALSFYIEKKLESSLPLSEIHGSIVKVVHSQRSGCGKSLHIKRLKEKVEGSLGQERGHVTTIRYMEKLVEPAVFMDTMTAYDENSNEEYYFIHLDMTPAIQDGLLHFAFNLFILGSIEDIKGRIWQRSRNHLYAVELTHTTNEKTTEAIDFLKLLPTTQCLSPKDILENPKKGIGMDESELRSERYQRVSCYLKKFVEEPESIGKFVYSPEDSKLDQHDCIEILLKNSSANDPSWSQLHHFVTFLDMQLRKCESSQFCEEQSSKEVSGLKFFLLRFMIKMAQDFSTPSVEIEDFSAKDTDSLPMTVKKLSWQKRSYGPGEKHPLICFNDDGSSLTFIDIKIDENGNVVNLFNEVLMENVVPPWSKNLLAELEKRGMAIGEDFDELTRKEKLRVLYKIMGIPVTERTTSGKWIDCLQRINDETGSITMKGIKKKKEKTQVVSAEHLPILRNCKKCKRIVHGNKFEDMEEMLDTISKVATDYKLKFTRTSVHDPDPTYELSTNNVLKILAIYMRFSCNIPVIIMGETGCGKTRMIKFISDLLNRRESSEKYGNLMTLRVHGGISVDDIHNHIEIAKARTKTFLFFDEANTTEAIYAIKEAICDKSIDCDTESLWIVAACNPYKKLSDPAIEKLKKSGLGYRTKAQGGSKEDHMHSLVYRVIEIPPSMKPFVWDFGQLGNFEEQLYVKQMVLKLKTEEGTELDLNKEEEGKINFVRQLIADIFSYAHKIMRKQEDECKYVSLRDVERCITAYKWFHKNHNWICPGIEQITKKKYSPNIHIVLQVLGLCYHASLENGRKFREEIAEFFRMRIRKFEKFTASDFLEELEACQEFIVSQMDIGEDIVLNKALRENIYMIALCTEMKIPLFLIGKPGSSKSLAKTIVTESLLGDCSKQSKCKNFKAIDMSSFQCSALTKAEQIQKLFEQCMWYQSNQNPEKYVSVVALDEIGLAEESPHMPLKILHALLESGSVYDDDIDNKNNPSKKLGFLGISNWALDPAKMNRGIFVTRGVPSENELFHTIKGIFTRYRSDTTSNMEPVLRALVSAYIQVTSRSESEYFGLRDLYSLVKMIKTVLKNNERKSALTLQEAMDAVITNFSGGRESHEETFKRSLILSGQFHDKTYEAQNISNIVERNLESRGRHLLLLTKQFFPLNMLTSSLRSSKNLRIRDRAENVQVIYGSAFPGDDNYAALCRNVNKIKVCMENDCIAIILNLRKIHESLYDALNQHYVTLGNYKYVDLGFGSSEHRIKCRVHDKFRMIFVEDTDIAYDKYPAPLINRLEKHHYSSQMLLTKRQAEEAKLLKSWLEDFGKFETGMPRKCSFNKTDAFTGYHENFANALVLVHGREIGNIIDSQKNISVADSLKYELLKCATIDSVLRLKWKSTEKKYADMKVLHETYFEKQRHENLLDFLRCQLLTSSETVKIYDVTTFSTLLMENDRQEIEKSLFANSNGGVTLLSLQSFETLQQFSERIDRFFAKDFAENAVGTDGVPKQYFEQYRKVLLIQCNSSHKNMDLIACARYCLESKLKENSAKADGRKLVLSFLLSTNRQCSANAKKDRILLQPTTNGEIVYIDELRPVNPIGPMSDYLQFSPGKIFRRGIDNYLQAIHSSEKDYMGEALDVHRLLLSCFSQSLSRLTSSGSRGEERIHLLQKLIEDKEFTRILFEKIGSMLEGKDLENEGDETQWIFEDARDSVKLLEAGTFRKAIWLSLKAKLSTVFSHITSIIDGNCNLNLAFTKEGTTCLWTAKLWMKIFANLRFSSKDLQSDKVIEVRNVNLRGESNFKFPFSFLFYDKVTGLWEAVDQDCTEIFMASLSDLDIWPPVDDFFQCKANDSEVLEILLTDMTRMAYQPKSSNAEEEMNAIFRIVKNWAICCEENLENPEETADGKDKPQTKSLLAATILKFLRIQKYFEQLSKIFENWPELTDSSNFEVSKCKHEMDILQYAFDKLVEILTSKISGLESTKNCMKWINEVYSVIQIFGSFSEETTLKSDKWTLISLLHLLFTQLTPSNSSKEDREYQCYLQVIAKKANSLGGMFKDEPETIGSKEGLVLVTKMLTKCFSDLKSRLLVDWSDPECVICTRLMKKPRKLECGHYVCRECIIERSEYMKFCKQCRKQLNTDPKDYIDVEPVLSKARVQELNEFKMKCTSFFLNYMTRFVRDTAAYDLILKGILLYDPSSGEDTQGSEKRLLDIDPLDLNIMTKAFILKYLLENYCAATVGPMNLHIQKVPLNKVKGDLISAIILHFESSPNVLTESLENIFAEVRKYDKLSLRMLESVANLRRGLGFNAWKINDGIEKSGSVKNVEIPKALQVFESDANNILRFYFIKYGSTRFGAAWLEVLTSSPLASKLIPTSVMESMQVVDLWQMLGGEYSLQLSQQQGIQYDISKLDSFQEIKELAPVFASFSLTLENTEAEKYFMNSMKQSATGSQSPLKNDFLEIMRIYCFIFVKRNPDDRPLIQLLALAALAIRRQPYLMGEFSNILQSPEKVNDLFLPTMPESLFFSVPKELRTKHLNWHAEMVTNMFACPNGHLYMIDNCTRPQERSKCPVCKENIGGENDKLDPRNTRFELDEKSQKGYILDKASATQNHNDNPDDRMSRHGVAVTRFILHSTLLLVVCKEQEIFKSISQSQNPDRNEFISYLLDQLKKDIDNLASALQKNKDDAYIVTYKILEYIIHKKVSEKKQSCTWTTIDSRKQWEKNFREVFLLPIFGNVDVILADGWNMMKETGQLNRLRRDLPIRALEHGSTETWTHPILWCTLKHLEMESLLRHIKDSPGSRKCVILQGILARPNLDSSRFIKSVLDLQSALIERYQYKLDLAEVDKITFSDYLIEDKTKTKRELVEKYFQAWKKTQAHRWLGDTWLELSMDSPISFALPNKRGKGKFAMLLSITLVGLHNEFLENCAAMLPEMKLEEVSVSDLQESHIVNVDMKRDLLELVKMHTKYDIFHDDINGSQHQIVHNFEQIENLVRENYVRHKKLIKVKTIPSIQYSQDTGIGEEWPALKKLMKQENLSAGLEKSVDSKISENPTAELYDGIRVLSHAIRFLVKLQTSSTQDKGLRQYMEKTLLMDTKLLSVIPSPVKIKHALALYQHLTWHKSVAFVRQGIDPYQDALPGGQEEIPTELKKKTELALKGASTVKLQKRINEILITKPDCSANWSLIEEVFPYAPYLDEDDDHSWFKNLPRKLCFCHVSHLFRLTTESIDRTSVAT